MEPSSLSFSHLLINLNNADNKNYEKGQRVASPYGGLKRIAKLAVAVLQRI